MAKYGPPIYPQIQIGRIILVRHNRTDLNPIFHCVSWREKRVSSINRRFYFEKGSYWAMPTSQALKMMRQAKQAGFFDTDEADPGTISTHIIADPAKPDYAELVGHALVNSGYDREWQNCTAVICTQSCGQWRKVMMVNKKKITFRSLTADDDYPFARSEVTADGWHLDAAMLDAHPTAFLLWLDYLESITNKIADNHSSGSSP
jgi:hypothetical protein